MDMKPPFKLTNHDYVATPFLEDYFTQFQRAYADVNFGLAYQIFAQALQSEPMVAYRYFATKASAELIATLRMANKIGAIAQSLNMLFPKSPYMNLMYYGPAETTRNIIRQREENIANGLPSVILITQGKSASVSISNIFNSGFNLPSYAYSLVDEKVIPGWVNDYARGGACYATHLTPSEENILFIKDAGIRKIIVHVRDPRQALISMVHHKHSYAEQDPSTFKKDSGIPEIAMQLQTLSGVYNDYVDWLKGWVKASETLPIYFSVFRDFVTHKETFIQGYVDYYGVPDKYFNYEQATTQHEGIDYHLRKGSFNEWQEVMPDKFKQHFSFLLPDEIKEKFGWPK